MGLWEPVATKVVREAMFAWQRVPDVSTFISAEEQQLQLETLLQSYLSNFT